MSWDCPACDAVVDWDWQHDCPKTEEFLNMVQSGPGDLKLDNLLSFAAAGDEVDIYSDFDEDEDSYDGSSMVARLSAGDALRLRDWLTTWLNTHHTQ